ncbi:MAG: hypothetical protein AAB194_02745, partial [Pseudomonadota bacterium]
MIHRRLGVTDETGGIAGVVRVERHADMSAEFERLIVDAKRRFQIALDCARLFERVFDIAHPVEHDGELAAVEVCHQIVGADKLLQAPADVLQHAIAHLEAKRVVDV